MSALNWRGPVLIGEGKAACTPPTRRRPGRSPMTAGQTAVRVMML